MVFNYIQLFTIVLNLRNINLIYIDFNLNNTIQIFLACLIITTWFLQLKKVHCNLTCNLPLIVSEEENHPWMYMKREKNKNIWLLEIWLTQFQ